MGTLGPQVILAFAFGAAFVVALVLLAVAFPQPTPFQYTIFRIILALAAGGVAAMIPGLIDLQLARGAAVTVSASGALAVFAITYFFNPAKLAAHPVEVGERQQAEHEQKLGGNVSHRSDKIVGDNRGTDDKDARALIGGTIIYRYRDSADPGFDFRCEQGQFFDSNRRPTGDRGQGSVSFENDAITIERTNMNGRYELWLRRYLHDGVSRDYLPKAAGMAERRRLKITFDAKAIGGKHVLKVVLKSKQTDEWLANESVSVTFDDWRECRVFFVVSPDHDSYLRIDDQEVSRVPSSVKIRNLTVTESDRIA